MKKQIADNLIEILIPVSQGLHLADVRLGLGYSAVKLSNASAGVCWSPKISGHTCTVFTMAGTLVGRPAEEMLHWMKDPSSPWMRVIGVAVANALLNMNKITANADSDILKELALTSEDHVAMVGRFGPLIPGLKAIRCRLDIIELEPSSPDSLTPEQGKEALHNCSVAVITGTSLVTATLDEILEDVSVANADPAKRKRAVVLLGPTVPLCPKAFSETPVTHLAGSWIIDSERVLQIVSEGGGTPKLKPFLKPVCLPVSMSGN